MDRKELNARIDSIFDRFEDSVSFEQPQVQQSCLGVEKRQVGMLPLEMRRIF